MTNVVLLSEYSVLSRGEVLEHNQDLIVPDSVQHLPLNDELLRDVVQNFWAVFLPHVVP